jgi:hypothetical protein
VAPAEAFAIQCAAGCAAEEVVHGAHEHGDATDTETIAACVETAGHHGKKLDAHVIMETARALCREHRGAIERVAAALLEQGFLSGADVDKIIARI